MRCPSVPLPIAMLLISLPVLVILSAASSPIHILEITYAEGRGRVFWTQINPGDRFSLEYIHSTQLSRVTDDFEIDQDHRILLVGTTFSDHGAGLPYHPHCGGTFSVQRDGRFGISDMRISLPEILLRVGREYDNVFACETRRINLSRQCGDALLTIRTRNYSILKRLLWRILNVG
jgi:hypothetical protein